MLPSRKLIGLATTAQGPITKQRHTDRETSDICDKCVEIINVYVKQKTAGTQAKQIVDYDYQKRLT